MQPCECTVQTDNFLWLVQLQYLDLFDIHRNIFVLVHLEMDFWGSTFFLAFAKLIQRAIHSKCTLLTHLHFCQTVLTRQY